MTKQLLPSDDLTLVMVRLVRARRCDRTVKGSLGSDASLMYLK